MTVSNQTNSTSAVGTGAAQTVPFTFPIVNNSDITVKTRVTATGVEATLTETTHYTVVNSGSAGGSITTVTPFVAATSQIHIIRDTPMTQTLDLVAGGSFNAENIEAAIDKNTRLIIENSDTLDRTLRFPETDPSAGVVEMDNSVDRAGKYLYFDSTNGNPTVASAVDTTDTTISAYMETVLDDATAAAARTTLGIGSVYLTDYDDLDDAVTTIGSTETLLLINTAQNVTGDVTVPKTMTLCFYDAGKLTVTATKTITINGDIIAPKRTIFAYSGTTAPIDFTANGVISGVYPEWFGADGTGTSDSSENFYKTIEACSSDTARGIPIFVTNRYLFSYGITVPYSNTRLIGTGSTFAGNTTYQVKPEIYTSAALASGWAAGSLAANTDLFTIADKDNIEIRNISLKTAVNTTYIIDTTPLSTTGSDIFYNHIYDGLTIETGNVLIGGADNPYPAENIQFSNSNFKNCTYASNPALGIGHISNLRISNLTFEACGNASTGAAMNSHETVGMIVDGIYMKDAISGYKLSTSAATQPIDRRAIINNVIIDMAGNNAAFDCIAAKHVTINNMQITAQTDGYGPLRIYRSEDVIFNNLRMIDSVGINFPATTVADFSKNITFNNAYIERPSTVTGHSIQTQYVDGAFFNNCHIKQPLSTIYSYSAYGIASYSRNIVIKGGKVWGPVLTSLDGATDCYGLVIDGLDVTGSIYAAIGVDVYLSTATAPQAVIQNCSFLGGTQNIKVTAGQLTCKNNTFRNFTTAIELSGSTNIDACLIEGNKFLYDEADATDTITSEATSAQKDVIVDTVGLFYEGQAVTIGTGTTESNIIESINYITSTLTMKTALANTYAAAEACIGRKSMVAGILLTATNDNHIIRGNYFSPDVVAGLATASRIKFTTTPTKYILDDNIGETNAVALTANATHNTGNSVIQPGTKYVTVTSASANNIITLPAAVIGDVITVYVGANGCEFQTPDASSPTINQVDCSGGDTNEAAIPATSICTLTCYAANAWTLVVHRYDGTHTGAITPDGV